MEENKKTLKKIIQKEMLEEIHKHILARNDAYLSEIDGIIENIMVKPSEGLIDSMTSGNVFEWARKAAHVRLIGRLHINSAIELDREIFIEVYNSVKQYLLSGKNSKNIIYDVECGVRKAYSEFYNSYASAYEVLKNDYN